MTDKGEIELAEKLGLKAQDGETLPVVNSIVMPAVSTEQALEAWKQYEDLKRRIVTPDDKQMIKGKEFLKKSYWRKIATFFNLTVDIVSESHEKLENGFVWHFVCKATAPNGRTIVGAGSCDSFEKAELKDGKYMVKTWQKDQYVYYPAKPNTIHNVRSTAETRAFNRAVSNLVGGGEVSADEVVNNDEGEDIGVTESAKCSICGTVGKYHKKDCENAL